MCPGDSIKVKEELVLYQNIVLKPAPPRLLTQSVASQHFLPSNISKALQECK